MEFAYHFFKGNEDFPLDMTASFRSKLVFQMDGCHTKLGIGFHSPVDVDRISVTGVSVGNQRNPDAGSQVAGMGRHLGEVHQSGIGLTDDRGGTAETRHVGCRKTAFFYHQCRKGIVTAGNREHSWLFQQFTKPCGLIL